MFNSTSWTNRQLELIEVPGILVSFVGTLLKAKRVQIYMQESFKYSETKFHNYTANLQSERMRVDPKIAEASRERC